MTAANIPLQMISMCDTDGVIMPIRFRFEDEEHMLRTVSVKTVVNRTETNYVGVRTICFVCTTVIDELEHMLEIRYTVDEHKWSLYRRIY